MRKWDLIECVNGLPGLQYSGPVSDADIQAAEQALGVKFADDYKLYLRTYGSVSADRIVLTGIESSVGMSVVTVTQNAREFLDMPDDMYVICINGRMVIVETSIGRICSVSPDGHVSGVCGCLAAYLSPLSVTGKE